jgi:HD superfamily phosphodiesterase
MFHTLQVFDAALAHTRDPILLGAALFHDVGKAIDGPTHDVEGADLLTDLLCDELVWLVAHHLDLLREPGKTRRRLAGQPRLALLEQLRRFDLAGRDPTARVRDAEWAVDTLLSLSIDRRGALVIAAPNP